MTRSEGRDIESCGRNDRAPRARDDVISMVKTKTKRLKSGAGGMNMIPASDNDNPNPRVHDQHTNAAAL